MPACSFQGCNRWVSLRGVQGDARTNAAFCTQHCLAASAILQQPQIVQPQMMMPMQQPQIVQPQMVMPMQQPQIVQPQVYQQPQIVQPQMYGSASSAPGPVAMPVAGAVMGTVIARPAPVMGTVIAQPAATSFGISTAAPVIVKPSGRVSQSKLIAAAAPAACCVFCVLIALLVMSAGSSSAETAENMSPMTDFEPTNCTIVDVTHREENMVEQICTGPSNQETCYDYEFCADWYHYSVTNDAYSGEILVFNHEVNVTRNAGVCRGPAPPGTGVYTLDEPYRCWIPKGFIATDNHATGPEDNVAAYQERGYTCTTKTHCVKFEDPQEDVERHKIVAAIAGGAGIGFLVIAGCCLVASGVAYLVVPEH